ncbi:uncharacterized protein [Engystomops pustulosus]|uniref:uncharacterized protein n=1 Tax=Engystomops pustulosus TaxID=76066 RepID=UPI003AFB7B61
MDTLASDLKGAWRQDLQKVQSDVSSLQERVDELESFRTEISSTILELQAATSTQESQQRHPAAQLDDLDNRNRRNNIRRGGLPEATHTPDLIPTLTGIFNSLLERQVDTPLGSDHDHRALRARSSDPSRPRDVICRIHYYAIKEQILQKARNKGEIDFDGAKITLFPDLSRRTLRQRAMLRPLLSLLQARNINYRWGFPFALHAKNGTKQATLIHPEDLPSFLEELNLPRISLPNWDDPFTDQDPRQNTRSLSWNQNSSIRFGTPRQQRQRERRMPSLERLQES